MTGKPAAHASRRPAYQEGGVSVYLGDAREVMADLPPESIDCVVTSPPYWGLRDFGVPPTVWGGEPGCRHRWGALLRGRRGDMLPSDLTTRTARVGLTQRQDEAATNGGRTCPDCGAWLGSLGLEPAPSLFVAHLVELFRGVRRLLKPTGTVWLNLGDTFYHTGKVRGGAHAEPGLKPKDLIGIPWRAALALQANGWWLRSDLVWAKGNPAPEPSVDRPVRAHEMLFLLSKQPRYYYDAEAVREPALSRPSGGRRAPDSATRHLRSWWVIPTQPFRGSHTATFPTRLVEPCSPAPAPPAAVQPAAGPSSGSWR